MVLEGNGLRASHLIIESVTHRSEDAAVFPTLSTPKGLKKPATDFSRSRGASTSLSLLPNEQMLSRSSSHRVDSDYCEALRDAVERGVEALCVRAQVTKTGIEFDKLIPVILD